MNKKNIKLEGGDGSIKTSKPLKVLSRTLEREKLSKQLPIQSKLNNSMNQSFLKNNKNSYIKGSLKQNIYGKNVYNAVERNNINSLEKLYNKYRNNGWNWKDEDDVSPIILASMIGNVDVILELLLHQNYIDINHNDKYGYTALMYAVINNSSDIVKVLLNNKNIDINKLNSSNNNALLIGCSKNSINTIQLLLNKGADFLIKNNNGLNSLSFNNESSKIVEDYIIKIMSDYTTFKKYFEQRLIKKNNKNIFNNFINILYNNGFLKGDMCKSSLFYGFILRFAQSYKPFLEKNILDKNILINYLFLINAFEEFLYTNCRLSNSNITKINKSFTPLITTIKNDINIPNIVEYPNTSKNSLYPLNTISSNDLYSSSLSIKPSYANIIKKQNIRKEPIFKNKANTYLQSYSPSHISKVQSYPVKGYTYPVAVAKVQPLTPKAQTLPISPKSIKYRTFNQYKKNIGKLSSYNYKSRTEKLMNLAGSYLDPKFDSRNKCIAKDQLLQIGKFPTGKVSKMNKDFIASQYRMGVKTLKCK